MASVTINREVRISRRRGLMARALENPNDNPKGSSGRFDNVEDFNSSISRFNQMELSNLARNSSLENSFDRLESSSLPNGNSSLHSKTDLKSFSIDQGQNIDNSCSPSNILSPPFSDSFRKRHLSKQVSGDGLLNPIQEHVQLDEETLSSTQHLRKGFFKTIKKQYPTVTLDGFGYGNRFESGERETMKSSDACHPTDGNSTFSSDINRRPEKSEEEVPFMSSMARKRLKELRKVDPRKVDVATGLQWIRLELHEMREQDKALFLQLIKLHSTIKEIRSDMKFMEENCDCSFDSIDGPASYWWPRSNGTSVLPDFSSSDGAHLLMRRQSLPMVRREFSFNQYKSRPVYSSTLSGFNSSAKSGSLQSFSSSMSSSYSGTAL